MARKIEVYTWRVSTALKADLEEAARAERRSVADLLDELVAKHFERVRRGSKPERQRRLHEQAAVFARRAERSRDLIRARLRRSAGVR